VRGGTHVPFSPPYHYLEHVARPAFARLGADFELELSGWGWVQEGKGEVSAVIRPVQQLQAAAFERVAPTRVEGVAAVTNLPSHIPQRMARRAENLLREVGLVAQVRPLRERGEGPGAGIFLWVPQAGFGSLGRPGLPADKVAEAAVAELVAFIDNDSAAVDHHLADQLLIPMSLAHGRSTFTTHRLSQHTLTNAALVRHWLDAQITVAGQADGPAQIAIDGIAYV
jgi:RNA 3'-terminal phosphate cyclase (ATP)